MSSLFFAPSLKAKDLEGYDPDNDKTGGERIDKLFADGAMLAKRREDAVKQADKQAKSGKLQLVGMRTKKLSERTAARASRDTLNGGGGGGDDDEDNEAGGGGDEEDEEMKGAPAHVRLHSSWSKSQAKKQENSKKAPSGMSFKPKFFTSRKSRTTASQRSVETLYQ